MKPRIWIIVLSLLAAAGCMEKYSPVTRPAKEVLVYSDAGQLPPGTAAALESAARETGIRLAFSTQRKQLQADTLLKYSAVLLVQARVDSFTPHNKTALEAYVQAGGGLLSLESPLGRPYTWPWYEAVAMPDTVPAAFRAQPIAQSSGEGYFQARAYDGGRIAHSLASPDSLKINLSQELAKTLTYLIGDNRYHLAKVHSLQAPDSSRFSRWVLSAQLDEPMELVVMPDHSVIFIERRGAMKRYDPLSRKTDLIAQFEVCTTGNYEDGLLGITIDPKFEQNHYLYLFYSPACEKEAQYLSRFKMVGTDSVILASEKIVLEVPVQRETCCHSGGSLAWGPDGSLFLSTGDNTSPEESNGYTPIDQRSGRSAFDAQKSSGNTNDLRGKVLRIRPNAYGSYDIPDGNLFPKNGSQGRPEIYAMGMRNPFRISVDQANNWLYWGDVGPDNAFEGKYGPETYDEVNQCREPGFFGWPYFVGPNRAFRARDFETDATGDYFDAIHPVNASPNNTGMKELPPAQPAFIYYPKVPYNRFPMLGAGSSSAMAGPVYHLTEAYRKSSVAFPEWFEGKLFIYEWARSWIQVVEMDDA
ncbi:MAG: carbohydrate-binding protein, partial [Bacteroidetes bacterium]